MTPPSLQIDKHKKTMNTRLQHLIELNAKLDTIHFMGGEWIDASHNGKKVRFKNTKEAQQVMSGSGSSDEKFQTLKQMGLAQEYSARGATIQFRRYEEDDSSMLGTAAKYGAVGTLGAGAGIGGAYLLGRTPYNADRLAAFKGWKDAGLSQDSAARMTTAGYGAAGSAQRIGGTIGRGVQRIGDYAGGIGEAASKAYRGAGGFWKGLWRGARAIPGVRFSSRHQHLVELNEKLNEICFDAEEEKRMKIAAMKYKSRRAIDASGDAMTMPGIAIGGLSGAALSRNNPKGPLVGAAIGAPLGMVALRMAGKMDEAARQRRLLEDLQQARQ
jgi:hypothetical protein